MRPMGLTDSSPGQRPPRVGRWGAHGAVAEGPGGLKTPGRQWEEAPRPHHTGVTTQSPLSAHGPGLPTLAYL